MITLEAPYYTIKGVTILRDHQDPDQFYYLPSGIQLAARADGTPAFTLFKYRVDLASGDPTLAKGGGIALFETEAPTPTLTLLTSELAAQAKREKARLSPVMFRSATAHAMVAKSQDAVMVIDVLEEHGAPLTMPFHSAFTLALNPAAAALVDQAARGGMLPVGVAYELRFLALAPTLHAHVTMSYDQAWDRFSASVGWTYVVKAQLDLEMAWLVEHDILHIEITAFSDDADKDRQYQAVMALVTARVQGDFFRTAIPADGQDVAGQPGPLTQYIAQGSGTNVSSASAYFVLKAKYEATKDTKTFDEVWNGAAAVELVHSIAGSLATLVRGKGDTPPPPPDIREIDATDPFFASLDGQLVGAFDFDAWPDLRECVVTLAHGDRRDTFTFARATPGPFAFRYPLASPSDAAYQYEARYDFDATIGLGPVQIAVASTTTRDRVLVIDPHAHVQYRAIRFVLGLLDPARVPRIRLAIAITGPTPAPPHQNIVLDSTTPQYVLRIHLPAATDAVPAATTVRVHTQWEDPAGAVHDGVEALVSGDTFVALGPYRDLLDVLIVPACDFTVVSQLLVTIHHEDGDIVFEKVLTFAAADKGASQHVQIPLLDPTARGYKYRVATFRADGTRDESDWQTDDGPVLVVGGTKKTTATLSIVWVGAPGAALGIRVDVWATGADGNEQQSSALLRPGQTDQAHLEVPLDSNGTLAYRYEVHAITNAGDQLVRSDHNTAPLLVVQMPAS